MTDPTQQTDPAQPDVISLAHRLSRRQMLVLWARTALRLVALSGGLALLTATVRAAWLPGLPLAPVLGVLGALTLGLLGWLAWRARPSAAQLLGLADRHVDGEEQLGTTYELETEQPRHPFLPLLRRRCMALVPRVNPRALLPLGLRRADLASLAFPLLALGLYLLPASLLVVSPGAGSYADSLVGEEGRLLEELADRLEEIALRERYQAVEYLADEIREESASFQQLPISPEDAAGRLDYLAGLADLLAAMGDRQVERTFEGVPGMGSQPTAPPESDQIEDRGEGDSPSGQVRGDTDGSAGSPTNRQDPQGGGEGPGGDDADQPGSGGADGEEDLPKPRSESEQALLESAKRTLEQEAGRMRQEALAESNRQQEEAEQDDGAESPADPNAVGAGGYRPESDWASAEEMGWDEPPRANPGESGALGEATSQPAGTAPDQTGFKDARLKGLDAEAESQVIWVKERPQGKMRDVQPEGGVPEFQHRTTTAQEKAAVPHAYRSLVKSYFLNLERLLGSKIQ